MTSMIDGRRMAGFLAIPGFLIVLALVGMALSTESKEDFEQRAEEQQQDQIGDEPGDQQSQGGQQQGQDSQSSGNSEQQSDGSQEQGQDQGQGEGQDQGRSESQGSGDGQGSAGDGDQGRPVVIRTENGDVVVELDKNGNPVRVVPGDSIIPTDPDRILSPDAEGNIVGFRVTGNGRLEPVERGDFQDGDFLTQPGGVDGVDIIRPNGTRVQLTPTQDGGMAGVEVAADGTSRELLEDSGDIVVQPSTDFAPNIRVDPTTEPLLINTDAGPVRIELEQTGDLVANQPSGEAIEIDTDDLSAIRVNEDGQLELIPLDEVGPDDTVLVPNDNGFDLVRPDGSRVEFRPDGENDGMTATEVTPGGDELELIPNPDGSVTLSDGTTVAPIDVAEDGGTFEQMVDRASDLPWPWVFGAIALLALLSIGTAVYLHRNRPDDPFDYSQFITEGVPEDQFEKFLAILLEDDDPSRAIRLAFYAAERGLGGLPPRRADETPFEWHARVEQRRPNLARPLGPICDMFARARFAPGQATAADRDLMVEHLRELNHVANETAAARDLAGV